MGTSCPALSGVGTAAKQQPLGCVDRGTGWAWEGTAAQREPWAVVSAWPTPSPPGPDSLLPPLAGFVDGKMDKSWMLGTIYFCGHLVFPRVCPVLH